jgi:serine/threonine protein kinase
MRIARGLKTKIKSCDNPAQIMALAIGTKLGPYEIQSPIGAGGMGEVYRARDTRLGRDVAIKILPEGFARDAERMARLRREAQVLASLNHPNIAAIYGFEDSGATHALVMELVEGPTLAERIKAGAIPLDEALPIAKQICEAVEYAHERGIIHRDLKPSNIKISSDGAAKVLDFGLAKAIEGDASATSVENSPTLSAMATRAGFLLGTAAYMSPEQARGKNADRRSDIWAFGVVLFEMLSATRLFVGETTSDTLAAVIRADPEWNELPANTPPKIRELLQRCLKKDSRQRLQSMGDARIAIDETLSGAPDAGTCAAPTDTHAKIRERIAWAAVALLTIVAAVSTIGYIARAPRPATAIVSEISAPSNANFAFGGDVSGPPVLSPDGQRLAFSAIGSDGKQRLWVRPLDFATAQPLEGTEGATFPFWSPDSRSLGFFASGKLNRIDASGGPTLAIASASNGRGGSWGADGTILYTPDTISPIYGVPASGGTPEPVTKLNASLNETTHRWPQFLPDGKHFLFYAHGEISQNHATYAASLDGGAPKLLLRGNSSAVYTPPGYLLFVRQGTLMAQRFDVSNLRLAGDAVPLAENSAVDGIISRGIFTVSENGILAYQVGNGWLRPARLLWFDRSGKQIAETGTPDYFTAASLSPDGRKLAAEIGERGTTLNIWVFDLARGIPTRLTFSPNTNAGPTWSPDGKTMAFLSDRSGKFHAYQKAADGTGSTMPLVVDDAQESFPSFSSDGRYLTFDRLAPTPGSHTEIWALPLFGDRKAFPVVQSSQFDVGEPALSPDGKWLAYISHETGLEEIYIVPFPKGTGKWEVSGGGGKWPRWRHDGKELFYFSLDNKLMSAEISQQGAGLVIGKVALLFPTVAVVPSTHWPYDVSADGKKFVVATQSTQGTSEPLTLVMNWPALLKKQ